MLKTCVIFFFALTIIFSRLAAQSAKNYDWKMMSVISGSYDWSFKNPTGSHGNADFWMTYGSRKDSVKNNLMRGKKLGFNSVRIMLEYIDMATFPNYDHAWPIQTGSGIVSTGSTYRQDVKDLVDWCYANQIKVCLTLFYYGGANDMTYYGIDHSGCRYAGPDSSMSIGEINNWFIDAKAWLNYMLGSGGVDLTKIDAFELMNEAVPNADLSRPDTNDPQHRYYYPTQPANIFYLEMTNYIHKTWPNTKLMMSIWGDINLWPHLKDMLTQNYEERPDTLTAFAGLDYAGKYVDILSIHDYDTYNSRINFEDILSREPYQSQPYEWFIGECGFSIGDSLAYEIDQAKYFQYFFQVAADLSAKIQQTGRHFKGIGVWTMNDHGWDSNGGQHHGIISSETPSNVRKRKAASVIEDNFEGYVDNPDFEIGPGNDANFNDSPYCNGWTSWYASNQTFNAYDYAYTTQTPRGHVLQLNPAPTRWIGWSSNPGGMIRVKPNTNITVGVDVNVLAPPPSTYQTNVFVSIAWADAFGQWIGSTPVPGSPRSFYPGVWTTIAATYAVPSNAYYAIPYLMAYNNPYTVQFDHVTYVPEWRPLISFTFDDDISYFGANALADHNCAIGWSVTSGSTSRSGGTLIINPSTYVNTSHDLPGGRITGIRMRQNNEYSAVGAIASEWVKFNGIPLNNYSESDDFPASYGTGHYVDVANTAWGVYATPSLQPAANQSWFQVRFENVYPVTTLVKDVTVFEHTLGGALPKIGMNDHNTAALPIEFNLAQNYPNPFNPSTTIKFDVPEPSAVRLTVYDYLGREVAVLVNEYRSAGRYQVTFDAGRLASGIYLYKIQAGRHSAVRKMQLVK